MTDDNNISTEGGSVVQGNVNVGEDFIGRDVVNSRTTNVSGNILVAVIAVIVIGILGGIAILKPYPSSNSLPAVSPTNLPVSTAITEEPKLEIPIKTNFNKVSLRSIANSSTSDRYVGNITLSPLQFDINSGLNIATTQAEFLPQNPTELKLSVRIANPRELFFLVTGGSLFQEYEGLPIGVIRLHFASGTIQEELLIAGENIREWRIDNDQPTVKSITSPKVSEVWRSPSSHGGDGIIDMLSINVLPRNRAATLILVEIEDTSLKTVASRDPAINWLGLTIKSETSIPPISYIVNKDIGSVTLLGYEWDSNDDSVVVELFWHLKSKVDDDYTVSLQLFNEIGKIAQEDHLAGSEHDPTSQWDVGDVLMDKYRLSLPTNQWPTVMLITMYKVNGEALDNLGAPIRVLLPVSIGS